MKSAFILLIAAVASVKIAEENAPRVTSDMDWTVTAYGYPKGANQIPGQKWNHPDTGVLDDTVLKKNKK